MLRPINRLAAAAAAATLLAPGWAGARTTDTADPAAAPEHAEVQTIDSVTAPGTGEQRRPAAAPQSAVSLNDLQPSTVHPVQLPAGVGRDAGRPGPALGLEDPGVIDGLRPAMPIAAWAGTVAAGAFSAYSVRASRGGPGGTDHRFGTRTAAAGAAAAAAAAGALFAESQGRGDLSIPAAAAGAAAAAAVFFGSRLINENGASDADSVGFAAATAGALVGAGMLIEAARGRAEIRTSVNGVQIAW